MMMMMISILVEAYKHVTTGYNHCASKGMILDHLLIFSNGPVTRKLNRSVPLQYSNTT